MSLMIDVGGEQNIIGAIQDHGRWPAHYPGAYRVEVGATADGPWLGTFEGAGNRGESKALFEAVRGRFIRITATSTSGGGGDDWSVAELKAIIDPGATPRRIPSPGRTPEPLPPERDEIRDINLAFDKDLSTRATSRTPNYQGLSFTFDLGGEYVLSRVVQVHGQWRDDYPAEYKIEVSRQKDESRFREVWRGRGDAGRSVAQFNDVVTRYVRITALRDRNRANPWSIAEIRTNRDPDVIDDDDDSGGRIDRPIQNITARGLTNINAVLDTDLETRATTNTARYAGSFIQMDMGGNYTISRVIQVHLPDERNFPGRYRIEVSENGRNWQTVWEGEGENGRSRANFTPVRARYVRVTATDTRRAPNYWSLSRIRISG
jgi:hypothetical protein